MAVTNVSDVSNQVQSFWSPLFMEELREALLLGSLVNKDYQGDMKKMGDTVYVSQVNAPVGQLLGQSDNSFASETLSTSRISIVANKRASAAYELQDLVDLQSQLGAESSSIRESLVYACANQINEYLFSLAVASSSAPDHQISASGNFQASVLATVRLLAGQAKWGKDKPWYLLLDPSFYSDLLSATTLTSSDYVSDQALVGGQVIQKRMGFNVMEDNSRATDIGLAFHPDFLHLVMQKEPSIQVSSLHSNKQFGYVISCDVVFGASLGIAGANKCINIVV